MNHGQEYSTGGVVSAAVVALPPVTGHHALLGGHGFWQN